MEKNYRVPGHLQSRCRRCQKAYVSYTKVPNVEQALTEIVAIGMVRVEDKVLFKSSLHECADGGTGIGDCIGGLIEADLVPEKMKL